MTMSLVSTATLRSNWVEDARHPGIEAQHDTVGAQRAVGRAYLHRGAVFQPVMAVLEAHAALQGHAAQAAHQFARLHAVAAAGENQPSRCRAEPAVRCTCSSGKRRNELMPLCSNAAITASVQN